VIAKSHGMLPLVERNEVAALVSAFPLSYCFALIRRGLLASNSVQLELQLQCVTHDLGATTLAPLGRPFDLQSNLGWQRDRQIFFRHWLFL
jgi:hypothetical protein